MVDDDGSSGKISGIKFIPLRTPGGEHIPGSGLFVKIKKNISTNVKDECGNLTKKTLKTPRQEALDNDTTSAFRDETVASLEESNSNLQEVNSPDVSPLAASNRRFTSPAILEDCNKPLDAASKLTVIAQVHKN